MFRAAARVIENHENESSRARDDDERLLVVAKDEFRLFVFSFAVSTR